MKSLGEVERDIWKAWLLERRFGGDQALLERTLQEFLYPVRDKILDRANLQGNETLLDHSAWLAEQMGTADRCEFAQASAEDLAGIADASVDVATTRLVLIYARKKFRN